MEVRVRVWDRGKDKDAQGVVRVWARVRARVNTLVTVRVWVRGNGTGKRMCIRKSKGKVDAVRRVWD